MLSIAMRVEGGERSRGHELPARAALPQGLSLPSRHSDRCRVFVGKGVGIVPR
jgi:hypothetical protein